MSDTDTYTVSFKTGEHYGASLIVVRGDTADDLGRNIKDVQDLLELVTSTEGLVHASYNVNGRLETAAVPNSAPAQTAQSAQGATVTPIGTVRTCDHGKRTRREGTSARGAWVGHFCPLRKGDPSQCAAIFEDN